ncbi:hypothetical protein DL769_000451 [Monosporascus sp. CRB-8-3]|nr:hypothetical protein DL769_000451 [Monosporascus sp. CRB-8-3]
MPKPNSSNAGGEAAKSSFTKRFELPALDFKFGSLTEGTSIPPPLPSPVEKVPTTPKTPVQAQKPVVHEEKPAVHEEKTEKTNGHVNGSERPPKPEITTPPLNYAGVKRPAEDGPASPTGSSRGSLRRLLSMSLLNKTYDEQALPTSSHEQSGSRPPSRTASTMTEEKRSKRSSGWFRRLRSHDHSGFGASHSNENKRMSQQFIQTTPTKLAGPPPPMIPELSALGTKVDTSIGDDIFKGIK